MTEAVFNPPGASYIILAAGGVFGWNESVFHCAFFLIALAVAAGIYFLARDWCVAPALATALAVSTPVFLLSATTLMCDMPMLLFWIWAIVFWEKGIKGSSWSFVLSGVVAGLAMFMKYNAILLLPLFAMSLLLIPRQRGWMIAGILVPFVMLFAYELWTGNIYGKGLFQTTRELASAKRSLIAGGDPFFIPYQIITLLTFLGGGAVSLALVAFIDDFRTTRHAIRVGVIAGIVVLGISLWRKVLGPVSFVTDGHLRWALVGQLVLWGMAGALLLTRAMLSLVLQRDRITLVLVSWIIMGAAYAIAVNWMVSGRGLLWLLPAFAILAVRQTELQNTPSSLCLRWSAACISVVIGWIVTFADAKLAEASKAAAAQVVENKQANEGGVCWFQGHWGLQYYLQKSGWLPLDFGRAGTKIGDAVVTPYNNVKILMLPDDFVSETEKISIPSCSWATSLHPDTGASFHANQLGLIPFYFGNVPPEVFHIQKLAKPIPVLE